ncbi:MAG TPA: hypothetical protein VNH83_09825 [Bryobacteraceae bacterium]|nr:hypothetical protein [Bryobacteraceae bacterium]
MPFIVTGTADQIMSVLAGPRQHDEHCKGWRWEMYIQDNAKRWASVEAALKKMHAERRAREEFQQAAE